LQTRGNMDKKKLFTLLYVILIAVVIVGSIALFIWIKSESAMCLKDPIMYFSDKTDQVCYCIP
jgi:hypothetical protein